MDTSLKNPKITVFMPAYNSSRFIKRSIESVLKQSYKNFEFLLIDDGSNDNTLEIIKSFSDSRIKLIVNPKNTGLVAVRNLGIRESKGEYIAFLDSDDIALPHRLKLQMQFMDKHQNVGLVGSSVKIIDENDKPTGVIWKSYLDVDEIPVALIFHNQFAQSSLMVRKRILPENPYREGFAPAEDYDLWVRLAKTTTMWNIPEILCHYRIHSHSSSRLQQDKQQNATHKIRTSLLTEIGITPTNTELLFHRQRKCDTQENPLSFLQKKELWLKKLENGNKDKNIYSQKLFQRGIAREWLETCYANSIFGLKIFKYFKKSNLSRLKFKHKNKMLLKFIIKCAMRRA